MTADAFRRESNRGQRIFDFMRNPPRHFAPCRLLLRLQQVRQILEHQHITKTMMLVLQRGHSDRNIQFAPRQVNLQLGGRRTHAVGTPQQRFQILQ